ncbi:MAG: A24 family peptidase, partial [Gammaproteobacteria bacterium]|nr:A24 family peptidase [Gammaproteobacteria bacterium]
PRTKPEKSFNLLYPGSHCPQCDTPIKVWHNVPLFSYLFLRGKCAHCKKIISPQYPIIELVTAAVTLIVLYRFGFSWQALAALILSWGLVTLSGIDIKEKILPDSMTMPLLWLGLLLSLFHLFVPPFLAIIGASVGYLLLWGAAKLYAIIRRREGMGHGDFKMLALLGAWLGVGSILNILIIASVLGLIFAVILIFNKRATLQQPLPFGPFLAIAGWLTLIWGSFILNWAIR